MTAPRILVTGIGVVSPIGLDVDSFWKSLCTETRSPDEFNGPPIQAAHMDNRKFHRVPDADRDADVGAVSGGGGNATRFAMKAVESALRDAGLLETDLASELVSNPASRIGVAIGSAAGDTDAWEHERLTGLEGTATEAFPYHASAAVASRFGLAGPNVMVSTACSAAGYGLSLACEAIAAGWAEVMVVGGTEAASRVTQGCFNRLMALDPDRCRPFDANRKGTVMGEGAAVLILESEAHARRRGRNAYAQVKGWGWSCDGHNPTAPDPSGRQAEIALRRALEESGLEPDDIDCFIPHGTGTALNDGIEGEVLSRVFGARMERIPASPIKSKIGHGAGASAAFSSLVAALILHTGLIPPIGNLNLRDPLCPLRLHRESALAADVRNVLVSSYAFGGNNISLVLGRPDSGSI